MHKTQLAAALVAVLGLALTGPALAADSNDLSVKKVNLADEKAGDTKPATEKKAKKSHKGKKADKGKEGSCKGKEGSCKSGEKPAEGGEAK